MADIEIIYSQQSTDFVPGRAYSNPRFFTTPRQGVSRVYIVGDWPKIVEAYEAIGVPVERVDAEAFTAAEAAPTAEPPESLVARLTPAQVEALDHDGDGKAGGSKPRAKRARRTPAGE